MSNGALKIADGLRKRRDLEKKYPYHVHFSQIFNTYTEISHWCWNQFGNNWAMDANSYRFATKEDEMLFTLTWRQ
jgi:hypothetical protein